MKLYSYSDKNTSADSTLKYRQSGLIGFLQAFKRMDFQTFLKKNLT